MPARPGKRHPVEETLRNELSQAVADQQLDAAKLAAMVNDYYRRTNSQRKPVTVEMMDRLLSGKTKSSPDLPAVKQVLGVLDDTPRVTFNREEIALVQTFRNIRDLDRDLAAGILRQLDAALASLAKADDAERVASEERQRARTMSLSATPAPVPKDAPSASPAKPRP